MHRRKETPQQRFGHLVHDLYWLYRNEIDRRLKPLDLSHAQWRPLLLLYIQDDILTQAELARLLDVEAPTVVRVLDRLGRKGWIERRPSPTDRRAHHIVLTGRAHALCQEIERMVNAFRAEALADIEVQDLERCNAVLERVRSRVLQIRGG